MRRQISSAKLRRLHLPIAVATLGLLVLLWASARAAVPVTITFDTPPPVGAVAAALPSGQVLIAGGAGGSGSVSSAELFSPATDTFTKLTGSGRSLTQERVRAVAAALRSGQVLIAGGEGHGSSRSSAELYNPATDTFTKLTGRGSSLTHPRLDAVAVSLPSGQVLIAGGGRIAGSATSAELYNPATDTFTKLTGRGSSLTQARGGAVGARLPSGQVLIAGGYAGKNRQASAELFNPATDTFTKLTGPEQSPTETRSNAVAATLPSGEVVIAGGVNSKFTSVSSAELFNPATDTFTKLTGSGRSLTQARASAVAARLPSGQVLIAGGERILSGDERSSRSLSNAELLNPATDTFTKLTANITSGEVLPTSANAGAGLELGAYSSSSEAPGLSSSTPSVCGFAEGEAGEAEELPGYESVRFNAAGTCTIVATVKATAQYEAAEAQQSFTVTRRTHKIIIEGGATSAEVGEVRQISARSAPTPDPPSLSAATPSVCTLSEPTGKRSKGPVYIKKLHFNATGTCTIVATLEETPDWEAAEAQQSFAVGPSSDQAGARQPGLAWFPTFWSY